MNDIAEQAKTISELTGNSKLANQIQKGQQIVHLAQNVMNKAETVAAKLNSGDILGSVSELLNSSSPTGLQFTLEALSLPATTFSVISFELREGYSEPYCLTVHLSSSLDAIDASQVLDQKVKFTLWQSGKVERVISGIVSSFTEGESGFEQTHYFLEIRPALWRSTLRRNSRLFQQKNLQQILTALLNEHDIPHYAFAFTDSHPAREFCVQWQETDFDFIQRLTAEEGIFYYFEEKEGIETLVFSDNAETLSSPLASPYNPNKTAQLQEQTVGQFLKRTQVRHSRAVLKDYTFKKPDWVAQFEQSATEGEGQRQGYEHYDYPGRFKGSEQGKAFTRYRLESLRRDAHLGEGESNIPGLSPGRLLTLSQHPNPEFNTTWQVIGVVSRGEQPQSVEGEAGEKGTYFTNHFQVIPRYQTWRPLQRTKPKVDGPQIAQVVGPKGEEIFTDNVGRVRVQFFWDREGKYDDHSSCWIRVSQAWAGQGWGVLAIPRVGQEVLVDFLDGDPDQPIITGRTYHTRNVPPGALPQSKTQMALRSKTYKGESYNELLFEDAPGQEQLNLHAQRDMNTVVLNDRTTQVGNNHREKIGEEQHIEVHQNRQKTVGGVESQKIGQNKIEYVKGDYLHFSNLETLLSSAEGDIIFETAGGKITITQDGQILMLAKKIIINGETVLINSSDSYQKDFQFVDKEGHSIQTDIEYEMVTNNKSRAGITNSQISELSFTNHKTEVWVYPQTKIDLE
ncbi:type VI secretion system tip protein VgrG [Avibacterium paragallinarum]|uniref:type VI secretion system Vgr family protein n=1 Tax=Avibacterium paragallinarum TaxID=728 RepID=UPI0021F78C5F|nr:type VI secretion system tip protein VgrG [Avibacterium paragallinarum]UXN36534.1 type VI secretion system tip protein VgrG [Avibacterium paragallinarum]